MRASYFFMFVVACADSPSQPVASGEVGPWTMSESLPVPRANHCSAVIDNHVVVIGGNHAVSGGFEKTNLIHSARMNPNGVLAPWQVAGTTLSPVTECAATSDGQRLYVIDGIYDVDGHAGRVFHADMDASGMFTLMSMKVELPPGTRALSTEATIRDGHLLVQDTLLPAEGDTTVTLRNRMTESDWSSYDWAIGFRGQAQYAFAGDWAFTIGGYRDAAIGAVTDVYVAPIGGGAPRATTPLPVGVAFGEAIAVDDWLFVIGGKPEPFGAPGTTNVFAAHIQEDGSLGAWETKGALPMGRTNHELVLAGDYLVVTGGAVTGGGDANVLTAQVRFSQSQ